MELSPIRDNDGTIVYFIEKMEPIAVVAVYRIRKAWLDAPAFQRMLEMVARVAPSEAAVLLLGESGTGKELVAKAIHDASRRAEKPFVVVDCSGLTETLFESEVFRPRARSLYWGCFALGWSGGKQRVAAPCFLMKSGTSPLSYRSSFCACWRLERTALSDPLSRARLTFGWYPLHIAICVPWSRAAGSARIFYFRL